jgi:hypothetical protein
LAGSLAFNFKRIREIYQNGFCFIDYGNFRWCNYFTFIWKVGRWKQSSIYWQRDLVEAIASAEATTAGYWILLPCYLIILYDAFAGHKLGLKKG